MNWPNLFRCLLVWVLSGVVAVAISVALRPPFPGSFVIGVICGLTASLWSLSRWPIWGQP